MDIEFDFPTAGLGALPVPQAARLKSGLREVTDAWDTVLTLDILIFRYAHLLDRLQPSAPGKIAVRFHRSASPSTEGRLPVWVQWWKTPHGALRKWRYVKLEQKSVLRVRRRYGPFLHTEKRCAEVIREISYLLERRAALVRALNAAGLLIRRLTTVNRRVADAKHYQFKRWKPHIERDRKVAIQVWDERYHGVIENGAKAPEPVDGEEAEG